MVTKLIEHNSKSIFVVTGVNSNELMFKKITIANAGVNILILAVILFFFGVNFYSSLYLISVFLSTLATIAVLSGLDKYSWLRMMTQLPSLLVTHNIIIIIGSASSYIGKELSFCVVASLLYILFMTLYEVRGIKRNPKFFQTAKNGLEKKIGLNYYCKPELGANLLHLSPIKRSDAWIRIGILGFLQKIMIAVILLLLFFSFFFANVGEDHLVSGFFFSIAGILTGIMGRPTLVTLSALLLAVFMLEKELNSGK